MQAADGVPVPQRYWAILTIALGLVLAVLDGAIANVALPTIARDVNASPADSIWVVNAYQLTVTISLLPLASIGDIFGYRRVYRWGLVVFTIASLGCALSDSLLTLTTARVVQGFGAAGIMSVNGALIRFIYPAQFDRARRRAQRHDRLGVLGTRPTVASAILSVAHWPWLFAVNVPIGSLAILIAWRALPRTPRAGHNFDVASAGMTALTIRPDDHRDRRARSWATPGRRDRRVGGRDRARLHPGRAAAVQAIAIAAGRSATHSAVRAVGGDLDLRLRGPGYLLCVAALLVRGDARQVAGRRPVC